jgi:hypothetical protein
MKEYNREKTNNSQFKMQNPSQQRVDSYDFYHLPASRPSRSSRDTRKSYYPPATRTPTSSERRREGPKNDPYAAESMYMEGGIPERRALHLPAATRTSPHRHYEPTASTVAPRTSPHRHYEQTASTVVGGPYDFSSPHYSREIEDFAPVVYSDPFEVGSVMTGMSQQELIRKKVRETKKKNRFSKKKKKTIVSMPTSFLPRNSSSSTEKAILLQRRSSRLPSESTGWKMLRPMHRSGSQDELELSTAETTLTDGSPPGLPRPRTILPYGEEEVPATHTVEPNDSRRRPLHTTRPLETDTRSLGEDSFPLLSRNATNVDIGDIFEQFAETPHATVSHERARSVRFSPQIVAPSSRRKRNEGASPTSVLPPSPKSILRASRFTAAPSPYRTRIHLKPSSPAIATSPPRDGDGFVDQRGVSLSPIRPAPTSHWLGHPGEKNLIAATTLTMTSSVARGVESEEYPDPPLELYVRVHPAVGLGPLLKPVSRFVAFVSLCS